MPTEIFKKITIAGLSELDSWERYAHILSLANPNFYHERLDDMARHPSRVELRFHDEILPRDNYILPTERHVEQILEFGRTIDFTAKASDHCVLVHCHSGISRSTAAAAILLAQALPTFQQPAIMAHIASIRPVAWPNTLMLNYADQRLGKGSRLEELAGELFSLRLAAEPGLADRMIRLRRTPDLLRIGYISSKIA
jgi:predicted protein tyrosine phosphatase